MVRALTQLAGEAGERRKQAGEARVREEARGMISNPCPWDKPRDSSIPSRKGDNLNGLSLDNPLRGE